MMHCYALFRFQLFEFLRPIFQAKNNIAGADLGDGGGVLRFPETPWRLDLPSYIKKELQPLGNKYS